MSAATEKKAHLWARPDFDWYVEPEACTRALLRVERFDGVIWDPACGIGSIVRSALFAGYKAVGSDVVDRADSPFWFHGLRDFLSSDETALAPNIICNPPFYHAKGTEAFVRKALALATGKVAMFTDVRFLAGTKRANGFYAQRPPNRIYILNPRPSCPPGDYLLDGGQAKNGSSDWVWLVYDVAARFVPATTFHWLSTDEDIFA